MAILGDMVDIFTYIVFIDNLYHHITTSPLQLTRLLLDVRLLKTEASLLVECLQIDGEEESKNTEACEDEQRHGVVVRDELRAGCLGCDNRRVVGVGRGEEVADELRNEAETDVLHPEDEAVSRTENLLVDNLRNAWPQSCRHESERDAEQYDSRVGNDGTLCCREHEGEDEVAADEEQCAAHEHRRTLTLAIEEVAEERSDYGCTDREPAEDVRGCFGRDAVKVALQHVGTVALEGEDGRIVEHAEQSYNPEHLRREYLAEVAELELFLWVGSLFCYAHLLVECLVHEGEDDEGDEADEEEHGAERYRSYYCAEVVGDDWRDRENSEHADACDSHLKTHSESHLLALEPLCDCLRNGCACHLAAAAEEHEAEASHLCACREVYPPRVEPLGKGGLCEPVGDADELDEGADEHHRSREYAGEANAHLVEDNAGDDEETEDVNEILGCCIGTEGVRTPSLLLLDECLDW